MRPNDWFSQVLELRLNWRIGLPAVTAEFCRSRQYRQSAFQSRKLAALKRAQGKSAARCAAYSAFIQRE